MLSFFAQCTLTVCFFCALSLRLFGAIWCLMPSARLQCCSVCTVCSLQFAQFEQFAHFALFAVYTLCKLCTVYCLPTLHTLHFPVCTLWTLHTLQGTVDAVCIPDVKPVREKQMQEQTSAFLWPGVAALMMSSKTK